MSPVRQISFSSGNQGRLGFLRGSEDLDHVEYPSPRLVEQDRARANAAASQRNVREFVARGREWRTSRGLRTRGGLPLYSDLSDEDLMIHMNCLNDELVSRFGPLDSESDPDYPTEVSDTEEISSGEF